MRFVFGVLLGFGIGFAGAILLAPEKKKKEQAWTPRSHEGATPQKKGLVGNFRERVSAAMGEARDAKKQAERDMIDRYERSVGRKSDD
jgi:gas vesicle protein